jgi:hypothetical protein
MPGKLYNSTQTTFAGSSLDLSFKKETLIKLGGIDAVHHCMMLGMALLLLECMIKEKLPRPESQDKNLLLYLRKLWKAVNILAAKDKLDSLTAGELKNPTAIHPTDSGFPLFIRDFEFLNADKNEAPARIAAIPPDEELVDAALFSLFRGQFPQEVINNKYARAYWDSLNGAELPTTLRILDETIVDKRDYATYYHKSVERLDDTGNVPYLYSMYFRVPSGIVEVEWKMKLDEAIRSGMGTAVSIELPYCARLIEEVDGVMLDMLERYTIGPFYDSYTANSGPIAELIKDKNDFIMMFQKNTVLRVAEQNRKGLWRSVRGLISGDRTQALFAPTLLSARHVLMPYRMVQKAQNQGISLGENVKMYGISKEGGLID